jgi:hypothetical protein
MYLSCLSAGPAGEIQDGLQQEMITYLLERVEGMQKVEATKDNSR